MTVPGPHRRWTCNLDVWSVYLTTHDAQKTIDLATSHGGQAVVNAMPVGDLGVMGFVTDPGGAAMVCGNRESTRASGG